MPVHLSQNELALVRDVAGLVVMVMTTLVKSPDSRLRIVSVSSPSELVIDRNVGHPGTGSAANSALTAGLSGTEPWGYLRRPAASVPTL